MDHVSKNEEVLLKQNDLIIVRSASTIIDLITLYTECDFEQIQGSIVRFIASKSKRRLYSPELSQLIKNNQLFENMVANLNHKIHQLFILEILGLIFETSTILTTVDFKYRYLKQCHIFKPKRALGSFNLFQSETHSYSLLGTPDLPSKGELCSLVLRGCTPPVEQASIEFITYNTSVSENANQAVTQSQLLSKYYNNKSIMVNSSEQENTFTKEEGGVRKENNIIQQITEENIERSSQVTGNHPIQNMPNCSQANDSQGGAQEDDSNLKNNFMWQDMIYSQKLEQMNNMPIHKINIYQVFPFRLIGRVVNFDMNTLYGFLKPRGWQNEIFFHIQDLKKQQMPQSFNDFCAQLPSSANMPKKQLQTLYLAQHKKNGQQILSFQIIIYRSKAGYKGKAISILFLN